MTIKVLIYLLDYIFFKLLFILNEMPLTSINVFLKGIKTNKQRNVSDNNYNRY